ncbi:bifunctional precorrin-2 dehydrogenase/sirohydrochlorin ferrochelatase [Halosquirtibacter xylanolyticus]|uniref:precorrin-2 dehydrogenase/sirohydrochlorin ferrochelatase family protein n=1 Tax=Halosquirtibacter xylanolyticus TaxID=3374599 RepID=UPI00374A0B48|nr:bifunctional precorrin-2 dehydrogenase/sirohydrochlorin ferrochelatase [Prolixibacteraceae bacterium]
MSKQFMPILVDVSDKNILIIGGGKSALKKVKLLQRFTHNISIIAQTILPQIKDMVISWKEKTYSTSDLEGYHIIYSCSNNDTLDQKILLDGHKKHILVNIHDNPVMCDFVSPAIYKDNDMTISVGSNGKNVFQSIKVRNLIQNYIEKQQLTNII